MSSGHRGLSRSGLSRTEVPGAFDAGAGAYDRLVGANPGIPQARGQAEVREQGPHAVPG